VRLPSLGTGCPRQAGLPRTGLDEPEGHRQVPFRALVYFKGTWPKWESLPQSTLVLSNCQNMIKYCSRTLAIFFFPDNYNYTLLAWWLDEFPGYFGTWIRE